MAVGRALYWQRLLDDDVYPDADTLARQCKLDRTVVKETLRFTLLAPDIVQALLAGRQPRTLTLQDLRRHVPGDWREQRERWGFAPSRGLEQAWNHIPGLPGFLAQCNVVDQQLRLFPVIRHVHQRPKDEGAGTGAPS